MIAETVKSVCSVDGCPKYVRARHLCSKHYERVRKGTSIERLCSKCSATIPPCDGRGPKYCDDCRRAKKLADGSLYKNSPAGRAAQTRQYAKNKDHINAGQRKRYANRTPAKIRARNERRQIWRQTPTGQESNERTNRRERDAEATRRVERDWDNWATSCTNCEGLVGLNYKRRRKVQQCANCEKLATEFAKWDKVVKAIAKKYAREQAREQARESNRERQRNHQREYSKSPAGQAARAAYLASSGGMEVQRAKRLRNRAKRRNALGVISKGIEVLIRKAQKDKCANCKAVLSGKGELDHIMPIARGGLHEDGNLQLLCRPCNAAKSDRDPLEFAQANGRLLF